MKGLLDRCEPGNLPPTIFEAVARLAVYSAVEFIPLRKVDNRIEVLLFERPANDIVWPSMLHTPGTVLRPTDDSYEDAFARLYTDEIGTLEGTPPQFIGAQLSRNKRGACLLLEYVLNVESEPVHGRFYDVSNLPNGFIEEQRASLERAVIAFQDY